MTSMLHQNPQWRFRKMRPAEINVDPIEGEFFTTEAVGSINDAIIRESIQNSLNAARGDGPVTVRFYFYSESKKDVAVDTYLDGLETDAHLWSWMSLFFFDRICPVEKSGIRKPGRHYRHILEPGYPNGHRHLLGGAYLVYSVYGLGDRLSRLLLWTPLHVESHYHHQLAVRQTLITNRGVLEAAHLLYFNESGNRPKRGVMGDKKKALNPASIYRHHPTARYDLRSLQHVRPRNPETPAV